MYVINQPRRRANAAQAETIDRLQPHPIPSRRLGPGHHRLHPPRLTGLGAADLHPGARIGHFAEIMVEADHPMHLGARKVQRLGNRRLGRRRNATEGRLNIVQDGQQAPLAPRVVGKDGFKACHIGHA